MLIIQLDIHSPRSSLILLNKVLRFLVDEVLYLTVFDSIPPITVLLFSVDLDIASAFPACVPDYCDAH